MFNVGINDLRFSSDIFSQTVDDDPHVDVVQAEEDDDKNEDQKCCHFRHRVQMFHDKNRHCDERQSEQTENEDSQKYLTKNDQSQPLVMRTVGKYQVIYSNQQCDPSYKELKEKMNHFQTKI
jgi:hypothetical protein